MSKRGSGNPESFWLWDGEAEYEGILISSDERRITARMRSTHRWTLSAGAPGRPVPIDLMERQRLLTRGVCFGHSSAVLGGALLEFNVGTVQPSRDGQYDYVIAGTFTTVGDEDLESLSQLNSNEALYYLKCRRAGLTASDARRLGESAMA